jgi:hypothetical protein
MFPRCITAFALVLICLASCKKKVQNTQVPVTPTDTTHKGSSATLATDIHVINNANIGIQGPDTFITYLIKKGNNYCEKNSYPFTEYSILKFKAILDSSCIYTTALPSNQEDINKLYGFGDCSSFHQVNSARFGWNWYNNAMRIHAYCYADSVRAYIELGTVGIGEEFDCKLTVLPDKYIFELNGKPDTMLRGCTEPKAVGYKLFPYFGGDESAPQDVRVKIKEY